jgi:membrane-associated phospholipid phosphatase
MAVKIFKNLFGEEKKPKKGLMAMEWVMMAYTLFTTIFILVTYVRLTHPTEMLWFRAQAVVLTLALWGVYRLYPSRLTILFRVTGQMLLLSWWYSDTYEMNRIFSNLDHVFAAWEQSIFGFQPALTFCESWSHPIISELVTMGYVSYFPLFVGITVFYFFCRYESFERAVFIIMASFFLFYLIFIFLPVAGPQFYFKAVGVDQIAQGVFPDIGYYFDQIEFDVHNRDFVLPIPGWEDGLMYKSLIFTHDAGERPTAAFPSSHVGVATVVMWLAWETKNRKIFFIFLPFAVLLFFGTFYVQAHYVIDAIAGLIIGTLFYFILSFISRILRIR